MKVRDVGALTGLPEYRNGGLFLDRGVLELRDPTLAARSHSPQDPLIVEWRALTVCLLDRLAPLVRSLLGKGEDTGELARGRHLARRPRRGP